MRFFKEKFTANLTAIYAIFILVLFTFLQADIFSQQVLETDEVSFRHNGKSTFDESTLKDAVAISKSDFFSVKIIQEDITKLKKFYFDNGFFDAVIDTSISVNTEDEEASVTFIITENRRYKIDSVAVHGIDSLSGEASEKINKIRTIKPGDNYSRIFVIQHINEVLDSLQNSGYMNARLREDSGTVITRSKQEGSVFVEYRLTGTDTLYYFGTTAIEVKENVYGFREELASEEIVYKQGEIYSKAKKLDSERNIAKIPIISGVKINTDDVSGNIVNPRAELTLGKKYELTPFIKGSNYENRFYAGAGLKYLDKYFLSGNRTLTLEMEEDFNSLDINRTVLSAAVSQPHFLRRNITLINKLSIGFNNVENYKNYFAANITTLSYFISQHTFYNNVYLDLTEELIWIKYDTIATGRQIQFNSFLGITFEHDNTNNLLSPSSGFYHSIQAGHAGLIPRAVTGIFGKSVFYSQFFKAYTLNKFYFSPGSNDNTVLAAYIKIGDIIEYGSGENVIPVQPMYKFYSGGSSSLRGWNAKENGMLENPQNGGTFLFEGSLELRKKLFPSSEGFLKNISGAFFIDYGNVWETHKQFMFSDFAYAAGFGVRYDLFIGPVRFDFGFRLYDPSAPEGQKWLFDSPGNIFKDKFAVQFGIGQAF